VWALAAISLFVAVAERLRPWRPAQRALRRALPWDLAHLVVNGHFLGVALYIAFERVCAAPLASAGLSEGRLAVAWPLWLQIAVALPLIDLLQWGVHNALHRVPFLWPIHQVHHSVKDGEMDWVVSFRFHWFEVVVYKAALYLPLLPFGFSGDALMVHAVFGTLIGHLNHANLDISWGPLRYLLNSPRMHLWHHDRDAARAVNFGIIFSCWDWLFGTAKMPPSPPRAIGFDGDEAMPVDVVRQSLWPWPALVQSATRTALRTRGALATAVVAALLLSVAGVVVGAALAAPPVVR
jgi:sterol desaturase/sphingolipid hydroxylase (fatty acid hydroxylase superfamily)